MDGDNLPLPDERPNRRREYSGAGSTLGVAMLIVLAVAAALWWFEVRNPDSGGGVDSGEFGIVELPQGLNRGGQKPAAQVGRPAPDFLLASPEGADTRLSALRGQWVLLNFWASWCEPCRSETPDLQSLSVRLKERPFTVVGVNQQERPATAREFTESFGLTYPIVLDRDGEVSQAYRVGRGLPVSLLLDPQGVIRKIYLGRLSADALAEVERMAAT